MGLLNCIPNESGTKRQNWNSYFIMTYFTKFSKLSRFFISSAALNFMYSF